MGQKINTGNGSTVAAVSTPVGTGGIAVIRMSGPASLEILSRCWTGVDPHKLKSHTSHLGWIKDALGCEIDQVVVTYFKAPGSFTGEDVVEISCHGSLWIQQTILNILIENGASAAGAGEFTRRAFANGRLDLAQAESIADMISASSKAAARLAATQLRGDFSQRLRYLRNKLIDIGALLELELDFSEEDVEFADRDKLIDLADEIYTVVKRLSDSYKAGNVFKSGVPVAIAGIPNAGKSTLLNRLVGEEKAIVSEIAGTTRDVIEDTVEISGILFRLYDTAGLRDSEDKIENLGIERAKKKISDSSIVLCLIDTTVSPSEQQDIVETVKEAAVDADLIYLLTKKDIDSSIPIEEFKDIIGEEKCFFISAQTGEGLDALKAEISGRVVSEFNPEQELIVTNSRHYEALKKAETPLLRLSDGLQRGLSGDFLAQDLREAEHYLGMVTGEISSEEILHTIFSRFCIGK